MLTPTAYSWRFSRRAVVLCDSLLHDKNPPNPDVTIEVERGIWARHGVDEYRLGRMALVMYLCRAQLLLPSGEHFHPFFVEEQRFVHLDRVEASLERFAITAARG